MNKIIFKLIILLGIFPTIFAQAPQWKYINKIKFPNSDTSFAQPYLCSVDSSGKIFVITSKVSSSKSHNAIYYAGSNDTIFKKMIDYDLNGDSDSLTGNIGKIRGITVLNKDIYINATIPTQRNPGGVCCIYYYKNGDTSQVEKFGFYNTGAGYGTINHGIAINKDSVIYSGITFNTSIRLYNFSYKNTTTTRGSWISLTTYPLEPGGPHTNGVDVIRDCAVLPNGNYNLSETPFYTSRNSLSSTSITGGIARWSGGSQTNPGLYTGIRLVDASNFLSFTNSVPNGITVDKNGILWVAGTDSTRRWIKGFRDTLGFAEEKFELPTKYSASNPNPNGAPITVPTDVALTNDALTAYVADAGTQGVYRFKWTSGTNISENNFYNFNFDISQNYPNPWNPSTRIQFSVGSKQFVSLKVFDILGKEVAKLVNEIKNAGSYEVEFNGENLSSGVYIAKLSSNNGSKFIKMILKK